jgi:hypothetical protein
MSIDFDTLCNDLENGKLERQDDGVRRIGDVLPVVLARYDLGRLDGACEALDKAPAAG